MTFTEQSGAGSSKYLEQTDTLSAVFDVSCNLIVH